MGQRPRIEPRGAGLWHVIVVSVVALMMRIPIWLSEAHVTFDEGVFLASMDLASAGLTQYRDFFASQGPLFLPVLQLAEVISFGDPRGARSVMVASGMAIAVASYFIFTKVTDRGRAYALSLVVAASGSTLFAAGPVQSEGPALALSLCALAVTLHRSDPRGALIAGALIGASVAMKSLHSIPIVLVIVLVLVWSRRFLDVAYTGLSALAISLGTAFVYGAERVWDQYVLFHLAKDNSVDLIENTRAMLGILVQNDLPTMVGLAATVGFAAVASRVERTPRLDLPPLFGLVWLALTLIVLVGFTRIDSGFARVLAYLIPPAATVIATYLKIPLRVMLVVAVFALPAQLAFVDIARHHTAEERAFVERLAQIEPDRYVVTDDPGLAWAARRLSHPRTVDPSFARFNTGYLTVDDVEEAMMDQRSCVYLAVSERFEHAGVIPSTLYEASDSEGLYVRPGC